MTRKEKKRLRRRKAKPIKKRILDALAWKLARAISKLPSEPQDHSKKFCPNCFKYFCNGRYFCDSCHWVKFNKDACIKEVNGRKLCDYCAKG